MVRRGGFQTGTAHIGALRLLVGALVASAVPGCDGCSTAPPPPTSEPPPSSITVVEGPHFVVDTADAPAPAEKKGMGWYPNIEVDADARLHLAWVDADAGDVHYAVSAPGGSAIAGNPITVDATGAVGSFLRLAVTPGGAPLLTYARQDTQIFRLAWRPADRAAMKAAGVAADLAPFPTLPAEATNGSPIALASGFIGEELGFGQQVGRGSTLTVDATGRAAVVYYSADDRLRLARRPTDVAAFSVESAGVWEKRDVDGYARGSIRVVADAVVLADGTVVIAYAHDVVTDARLRVAILAPGAVRASTIEDDRGPTVTTDGLLSRLVPRTEGGRVLVDVVAHAKTEGAVLRRTVDVASASWLPDREVLVELDGAVVTAARPGGWFALARVPGEGGGVFLYVIDVDATDHTRHEVRRIRLDGGSAQNDSWLDLAVRADGRPAAVWFDAASKSLKLYAP